MTKLCHNLDVEVDDVLSSRLEPPSTAPLHSALSAELRDIMADMDLAPKFAPFFGMVSIRARCGGGSWY